MEIRKGTLVTLGMLGVAWLFSIVSISGEWYTHADLKMRLLQISYSCTEGICGAGSYCGQAQAAGELAFIFLFFYLLFTVVVAGLIAVEMAPTIFSKIPERIQNIVGVLIFVDAALILLGVIFWVILFPYSNPVWKELPGKTAPGYGIIMALLCFMLTIGSGVCYRYL